MPLEICNWKFTHITDIYRLHKKTVSEWIAKKSLGSPALAQSAAELWLTKIHLERANHMFGVIGLFLKKFGFLSHNF